MSTPTPTPNVWSFGPPEDDTSTYSDGTVIPSRRQTVALNGVVIGELEIHTHKRKGRDGRVDFSAGITVITYGPVPGGN